MKTLDEVIQEFENREMFVQYYMQDGSQYSSDALHYLKEYHEHLKHCLTEEKKKIKQAYEQGYAQAKHDDEVSRKWEESYRQSQMPWNHYTEMGG